MLVVNLDPTIANTVTVARNATANSINVVLDGSTFSYSAAQVKGLQVVGATNADQIQIDPTVNPLVRPVAPLAVPASTSQLSANILVACACTSAQVGALPGEAGSESALSPATQTAESRGNSAAATTVNGAQTGVSDSAASARSLQDRAIQGQSGFAGDPSDSMDPQIVATPRAHGSRIKAVPAPSTSEETAEVATPQGADDSAPAALAQADAPKDLASPADLDRFFKEQSAAPAVEQADAAQPVVATTEQPTAANTGDETADSGQATGSWQKWGMALAAVAALVVTHHQVVTPRNDRRRAVERN
jgi:hypothetical protein